MKRVLFLLLALLVGVGVGFAGGYAVWGYPLRPFEQEGTMNVLPGQEATVAFPLPFKLPPNVTVGGRSGGKVVVLEATATNFKWKSLATPEDPFWHTGEAVWTARGVK